MALKSDSRDATSRQEVQECLAKVEKISQELEAKLDSRGKVNFNEFAIDFDEYEELIRKRLDEHQSILIQKSNIKDVCALLDMKSSKYFYEFTFLLDIEDVNKALSEVSDEL